MNRIDCKALKGRKPEGFEDLSFLVERIGKSHQSHGHDWCEARFHGTGAKGMTSELPVIRAESGSQL